MTTTTIRKWLNDAGFDWSSGRIIWQDNRYDIHVAANPDDYASSRGAVRQAIIIDFNHPILDFEFDDDYGLPEAPSFIADDAESIYFADDYDGSQRIRQIYKDITRYLDPMIEIPLPGGG